MDSRVLRGLCLGAGLLLVVACSKDVTQAELSAVGAAQTAMAPPDTGDNAAAAYLAYEHTAGVRVAGSRIAERVEAVQAACRDGRFGQCVVLDVYRQGGDHPSGRIGMRIVPAGVEPMIELAGDGTEPGTRSTRAEDLAVVVRDNSLARERLLKESERLGEFQARGDLSVGDMITLSERLASVEAQLEGAEREAAQHRRRIDTQLLTIDFNATRSQAARGEVAQALRDFAGTLATGTAWTIRATAFLLPLSGVLLGLVALVRRWRRRRRG
ncbi:DUF4349 domain-containing protein [Luteimonas sp. A501]